MTYKEKLLDPRWQKKRLEILERDKWTCQWCHDSKSTLHVHHTYYQECEPWETDTDLLICICSDCHSLHHKLTKLESFLWECLRNRESDSPENLVGLKRVIRYVLNKEI